MISTSTYSGGAEVVLRALLERGEREGFEQVVLNPFGSESNRCHVAGSHPSVGFAALPVRGKLSLPKVRRELARSIEERRPDVVHAHLFHAAVLVASIPRRGIPQLLTHHHGDYLLAQGRRVEARVDRWAGRRYDRIVAVSQSVKEFLTGTYRYSEDRVETIRNGWCLPEDGIPESVREGGAQIVTVGNLRPEKGHLTLIRAMARVHGRYPKARLAILGDGPQRKAIEEEVERSGLREVVELVGSVENVWPYLAASDVFVFPSLSEPLGIAIMEAMAVGLPVVAARVGGIPELVDHGRTGLLVEVSDPIALALALEQLLSAPDLRRRFGAAAREASVSLSMDRTTDDYVALYDRMAGQVN